MPIARPIAALALGASAALALLPGCFREFEVDDAAASTPSSSSSSSSGAGGGAGGGGGAPTGCAVGKPGPTLVAVPPDEPRFCIDETEVTNAHYHAFLGQLPSLADLPERCSWKTSHDPGFLPPVGQLPDHAVVTIDWCDAWAFCHAAGKRLCGKVDGGPIVPPEGGFPIEDMFEGEWYFTCSAASTKAYPYGNTYDPNACNDDGESQLPVLGKPTCEGGFPGVFDMTGGVWELQDNCSVTNADPKQDICRAMGGSFYMDQVKEIFACGQAMFPSSREHRSGNFGFRCCDDLE